ncbi:hypothetical protein AB0P29_16130, partial [Microbacterium sp. NPDC080220]
MKWSKKAIGLAVFGASATLVLAGCSTGTAPGGTGGDGGDSGDDAYNIAFVQGVAGDEFYISMECGIKEAAD